MKLLVCGGREFTDVEYAIPRIHRIHVKTPVTTLICGMAKGGDSIALAWARELNIPVEEYYADWKKHGKAAGPIRNQKMADDGHPDMVLALPGGNGTAGMVEIARKAGIHTVVCRYNYFTKEDPVYGFLSNFYPSSFLGPDQIRNDHPLVLYRSSEHYYQAAKTLDPTWHYKIIETPNAAAAKKLGGSKSLPIRDGWDDLKQIVMAEALALKFSRRPEDEMTTRLLHTGDEYLVEYAPWGDTYWGVDKEKKGQNWLGRLQMRRRSEIMYTRPPL